MDEKRREKSAEKKRREGKSCGERRKVIEGGEDGIMRCRFRDDAEEKERNERREEGG